MWISLGGLILGIIATLIISRYYFRRSHKKSLTPYIQFSSSPLRGIDPKVRAALEVRYQGHPIGNLHEIQFLIANTGDKAIRDIIEPLFLSMPEECTLLDASLLHVTPEGRKVNLSISEDNTKVVFHIPLLNSGEFFITKLLINGEPNSKDFLFRISADELPPILKPSFLPYDAIGTSVTSRYSPSFTVAGLVVLILGLSVARLIYDGWPSLPTFDVLHPWSFFVDLRWSGYALLVSAFPAFFFLVSGVIITIISFTEGTLLPPRRRFVVPNNRQLFRGPHFPFPTEMARYERLD